MLLSLSKKELAAIEAVLDIALNGGGGPVQSSDIVARQGIAPRYLEPILQRLGRAGVLVGIRGPSGGYRLGQERRRITLWDLIAALHGDEPAGTVADSDADRGADNDARAVVRGALAEIEAGVAAQLRGLTIEDLCWRIAGAEAVPPESAELNFMI